MRQPISHCRKTAPISSSPLATLRKARLPISTAIAVMLLAACSSSESPVVDNDPAGPVTVKQFTGDNACVDLELAIETSAIDMMREQIQQVRYRPVPVDAVGGGVRDDAASVAPPESAPDASGSGQNYSETNVQVAGVDELDPVKNDGNSLYTLTSDGSQIVLTHTALRPASNMQVIGQSRWSARSSTSPISSEEPIGLYRVSENQVVAVTSGNRFFAYPSIERAGVASIADESMICVDTGCGPGGPAWAPQKPGYGCLTRVPVRLQHRAGQSACRVKFLSRDALETSLRRHTGVLHCRLGFEPGFKMRMNSTRRSHETVN